jgi:CubicO group peptidase (beta-lactamase class C family)
MKVIRNLVITGVLLFAGMVGLATMAGDPPAYLAAAPGVGTGIGAKLLCSARYVSGFDEARAYEDLVQYSPILANLTIDYDDAAGVVSTSLFGLSQTTASYTRSLGCSIDYEGYGARSEPLTHGGTPGGGYWPAGDRVYPPRREVQALIEHQLAEDNRAGLNTRALLVAHQGNVIAEAYDQGADKETPLLGWSMAKSLTSVMLGNLSYRHRIDLSATPVFSAWANDERARITLTDLLTMTDGLAFSEQYNPGDDATAMLFTEPSVSAYVLRMPLTRQPGSYFSYSSGTANLLSQVHFDKTGATLQSSYRDFMDNIYEPMAFQNAIFEVDASGVFMGSSYFYASARDWARLGQLMLNDGVINGRRLISSDWIRASTSPNSSENEKAYGYLWWLNSGDSRLRWPDLPADSYAAQGNRQQWIMIVPSRDVVIVRLGWTAGRYPVNERFVDILQQL